MQTSRIASLALFGSALAALAAFPACSPADPAPESCDPAPEPGAALVPRARPILIVDPGGVSAQSESKTDRRKQSLYFPEDMLAPTGLNWSNGNQLNGIQLNGMIWSNGVQWSNGIQLNGMLWSNGVAWSNGIQLNGIQLNGIGWANGTGLNGGASNELVGTTPDGRLVGGDAFVGAKLAGVLSDGRTIELVATAFERSTDGQLAYYRLEHEGRSVCAEGEKGMFVPGIWDGRGNRHDDLTVGAHTIATSYSCTSGVLAKCTIMGYAPWRAGKEMHQACTRMARADYCGDGAAHTRNGTRIDVFDAIGVNGAESNDMPFEAAWGPDGAVCVSRTRFDDLDADGAVRLPSCWQDKPRCSDFASALESGAKLANASLRQTRRICSQ